MNSDEIIHYIESIRKDYEKHRGDKDPVVWLKEALMRNLPDMDEEKAEKIKNELIEGIKKYREAKEKKLNLKDFLQNKGDKFDSLYEKTNKELEKVFTELLENKTDE